MPKPIHTSKLQSFERPKKIIPFSPVSDKCLIPVKCIDVYDGDTVKLAFHLFNNPDMDIVIYSCRLDGIDAPEVKSSNEKEKQCAKKSRDYLRELCLDKCIWAEFFTERCEKYGRLLVDLYVLLDGDSELTRVNDLLIQKGYACSYDGGTKTKMSYSD